MDMIMLSPAGGRVRCALRQSRRTDAPYRYWLPHGVLPFELAQAFAELPFPAPVVGDTLGKRETHNQQRIFVSPAVRQQFSACSELADTFQDEATVGLLQDMTGTRLEGGYLRIECCLDTDGFWLEPHTDIGAKMLTLLVYLSDHPDAANWGTDVMDSKDNVMSRAPGTFNDGLMFVPGADTWHGFTRRPIAGLRRSLIVNYVRPEWRSRHELAFPDQPVVAV